MNISELNSAIRENPESIDLHIKRGREHFKVHNFGAALNDFKKVCELEPDCVEAQEYIVMINEILEYRYTDILNP